MFEKDKREQRRKQEDAAFNKMLLWLLGAVVVELLLLLIKKFYVNFAAGTAVARVLLNFFHIFTFLGAVLTAAGIVWAVLYYRKGKHIRVPCICTAAVGGLWVLSVMVYYLYETGINVMLLLPAVAAALIVVYFLYQRVFFLNALMAADGLLLLWLYRRYYTWHPTAIRLFFVGGFVLLAAALVLAFLLRRADGELGGLRLTPPDTDYRMTWITCGVTALAMVLTLALGATAGLYLLFALVGWVFIQAVFFTVQLM